MSLNKQQLKVFPSTTILRRSTTWARPLPYKVYKWPSNRIVLGHPVYSYVSANGRQKVARGTHHVARWSCDDWSGGRRRADDRSEFLGANLFQSRKIFYPCPKRLQTQKFASWKQYYTYHQITIKNKITNSQNNFI